MIRALLRNSMAVANSSASSSSSSWDPPEKKKNKKLLRFEYWFGSSVMAHCVRSEQHIRSNHSTNESHCTPFCFCLTCECIDSSTREEFSPSLFIIICWFGFDFVPANSAQLICSLDLSLCLSVSLSLSLSLSLSQCFQLEGSWQPDFIPETLTGASFDSIRVMNINSTLNAIHLRSWLCLPCPGQDQPKSFFISFPWKKKRQGRRRRRKRESYHFKTKQTTKNRKKKRVSWRSLIISNENHPHRIAIMIPQPTTKKSGNLVDKSDGINTRS